MPKATSKSGDFSPIPSGIHHAVCYSVIDLGTQPSQMFAPSRKVLLIWELPHERGDFMDEASKKMVSKPRVISKEYTLSTGAKSNLRRELESWRGRPFTPDEATSFEVGVLAEKNCQINIAHKPSKDGSKVYANVISIVPLAKGQAALKPENPVLIYDLPAQGKITFPPNMPEWIQTKIKGSEEYHQSINYGQPQHQQENNAPRYAPATQDNLDEDVPF